MRRLVVVAAIVVGLAGCAGDDGNGGGADVSAAGSAGVSEVAGDPAVRFETVTVDGTLVEYAVVTPPGFAAGSPSPVILALPPGGQDRDTTERVTSAIYAAQATARGYVVLSPVAPAGKLFFSGSEALIPAFLDATAATYPPAGGRYLLAGVSNGGISAFRVAGEHPDRFAAMLVFPGYPTSDADREHLADIAAAGVAVQMFVGGDDTGWIEPMQDTLRALDDLGVEADLEVVSGEGHIIGALQDGEEIFDFFDSVR